MTIFESKMSRSVWWLPCQLLLLALSGGCAVTKQIELEIALQGSDAHAALLELHDTLLDLDFVEQEIPPDVPRRVDRVYRHLESWAVAVSIDAFRQEDQLVIFLGETTPPPRASPLAKKVFGEVHDVVQTIFGPENVKVVEIHRSLR